MRFPFLALSAFALGHIPSPAQIDDPSYENAGIELVRSLRATPLNATAERLDAYREIVEWRWPSPRAEHRRQVFYGQVASNEFFVSMLREYPQRGSALLEDRSDKHFIYALQVGYVYGEASMVQGLDIAEELLRPESPAPDGAWRLLVSYASNAREASDSGLDQEICEILRQVSVREPVWDDARRIEFTLFHLGALGCSQSDLDAVLLIGPRIGELLEPHGGRFPGHRRTPVNWERVAARIAARIGVPPPQGIPALEAPRESTLDYEIPYESLFPHGHVLRARRPESELSSSEAARLSDPHRIFDLARGEGQQASIWLLAGQVIATSDVSPELSQDKLVELLHAVTGREAWLSPDEEIRLVRAAQVNGEAGREALAGVGLAEPLRSRCLLRLGDMPTLEAFMRELKTEDFSHALAPWSTLSAACQGPWPDAERERLRSLLRELAGEGFVRSQRGGMYQVIQGLGNASCHEEDVTLILELSSLLESEAESDAECTLRQVMVRNALAGISGRTVSREAVE